MRPIAACLLAFAATACHEPPPLGAPPGEELVLLAVELFESETAAPDLEDPRQATSLGLQLLEGWDTGMVSYEGLASVVQSLPEGGLRATPAAAGGAGAGEGQADGTAVAVPAAYQNPWLLRLELEPSREAGGRWSARGRFQLILNEDYVAVEQELELESLPEQEWRIPLGRSLSSGGYLHARVTVVE